MRASVAAHPPLIRRSCGIGPPLIRRSSVRIAHFAHGSAADWDRWLSRGPRYGGRSQIGTTFVRSSFSLTSPWAAGDACEVRSSHRLADAARARRCEKRCAPRIAPTSSPAGACSLKASRSWTRLRRSLAALRRFQHSTRSLCAQRTPPIESALFAASVSRQRVRHAHASAMKRAKRVSISHRASPLNARARRRRVHVLSDRAHCARTHSASRVASDRSTQTFGTSGHRLGTPFCTGFDSGLQRLATP
jgi:hypothetical protein